MERSISSENADVPFNPGYGVEPPRFAGRELVEHTILLGLQRGPGREEFINIVTGGRGTGDLPSHLEIDRMAVILARLLSI